MQRYEKKLVQREKNAVFVPSTITSPNYPQKNVSKIHRARFNLKIITLRQAVPHPKPPRDHPNHQNMKQSPKMEIKHYKSILYKYTKHLIGYKSVPKSHHVLLISYSSPTQPLLNTYSSKCRVVEKKVMIRLCRVRCILFSGGIVRPSSAHGCGGRRACLRKVRNGPAAGAKYFIVDMQ
jgi:hypothetical protein